jgi:hypothetical protein
VRARPRAREFVERFHAPGNLEVVATLAAEVAAVATDRHHLAVGAVVKHRLVADRLDFDRRDDAVGKVVEFAVAIHVRLAEAALAVPQAATPQAQVADHVAVVQRLLQLAFDELVTIGHRAVLSLGLKAISVVACGLNTTG